MGSLRRVIEILENPLGALGGCVTRLVPVLDRERVSVTSKVPCYLQGREWASRDRGRGGGYRRSTRMVDALSRVSIILGVRILRSVVGLFVTEDISSVPGLASGRRSCYHVSLGRVYEFAAMQHSMCGYLAARGVALNTP